QSCRYVDSGRSLWYLDRPRRACLFRQPAHEATPARGTSGAKSGVQVVAATRRTALPDNVHHHSRSGPAQHLGHAQRRCGPYDQPQVRRVAMFKRLTAVLVLTLALVLGFAPSRQAVLSNVLSEAEVAVINESSATEDTQTKQDGGNRVVKVLAAPFKAIGRLFGHGGKKDDNKLHRLSEKDVKKFESAGMTRVVDARNTVPDP